MTPLDPDPRYVEPEAAERWATAALRRDNRGAWQAGWDMYSANVGLPRSRRRWWLRLLAAFLLGLAIGLSASIVRAAPRPAAQQGSSPLASQGAGAPEQRTGAPHGVAADTTLSTVRPSMATGGSSRAAPQSTSSKAPLAALVRSGIASWYDDGIGLYAAAPGWRFGQTPYPVAVCAFDGGRSSCVTVFVRDACGCPGGRIIDLSPAAFRQLAPLSAGLIRVRVERLR